MLIQKDIKNDKFITLPNKFIAAKAIKTGAPTTTPKA